MNLTKLQGNNNNNIVLHELEIISPNGNGWHAVITITIVVITINIVELPQVWVIIFDFLIIFIGLNNSIAYHPPLLKNFQVLSIPHLVTLVLIDVVVYFHVHQRKNVYLQSPF